MRAKFFVLPFLFLIAFEGTGQNNVNADTLISFAKTQLGVKYKYGSIDPKAGFDCSGFVYYVFEHFKIKVPRASMDYEKAGKIISTDSCTNAIVCLFTTRNCRCERK